MTQLRHDDGSDGAAGDGSPAGNADDPGALRLVPIGLVRTSMATKVEAPRQPAAASAETARIELLPNRNFEHALEDLAGWDYLWVIYWFHLNEGWRPKVLPPRSTTGRKGVFATRSPHRPNPLGLSAVRLERIEGLTLHVRGADMVDGTPVLDLKPYVPYTDAHPDARSGWLEDAARAAQAGTPPDPLGAWQVHLEPLAAAQADWVRQRTGLPLRERVEATLALGPQPNPYRRIKREGEAFRLAIRDWRMRFAVDGRELRVLEVRSGYRAARLATAEDPGIDAHREFINRWPSQAP
ncbi:MAG: tRNA (N6-threonylcarbamoyladenosine(37)-N6)-methyltransferase TrmO [Steroidobacteraceae bacterium]|jgi:tRNA-Thr(GGU) m(6)t(6)A37 methyltransferase TsaA|nr:tRNA (N6-threonylcarbamoyladenosine(37)-N6)-methyltransferase TrmO [Steroidobacteraceae bacterium]